MATKECASNITAFGVMAKFDPVKDNGQIPTSQFLQACTELANILDEFGSGFSMPKKDMLGNIKRIDERYRTDPGKYVTINIMLEEDSTVKKATSTVVGVIWLRRALHFLLVFLKGVSEEFHHDNDKEDLRSTILSAYETTLKPFHGRIVQFMFSNISRLVPYRSDFLKSLIKDPSASSDQVVSDIDLFLPNLTANVELIEDLLNKHGVNSSDKA